MSFFLRVKSSILENCNICNQLDKLKHAIAEKQPKLVNPRGYYNKNVALTIQFDILSHLLYFPNLALSDYYLFLLRYSNRLSFIISEIKTYLEEYFTNKFQQF